jgi:hypothetical protein
MSYQEKRTIVSLLATILISAFYFRDVLERYQASGMEANDVFRFWGAALIIYIPVIVIFKIIIYIVLSVINTVATKEEEPDFTDELDRLIEMKSTRNFYHVFMAGFLLSLGIMVLGQPPVVMFLVLAATIVVAGIVLDVSQFYYYRRGV